MGGMDHKARCPRSSPGGRSRVPCRVYGAKGGQNGQEYVSVRFLTSWGHPGADFHGGHENGQEHRAPGLSYRLPSSAVTSYSLSRSCLDIPHYCGILQTAV
jgi:hypothetical protein